MILKQKPIALIILLFLMGFSGYSDPIDSNMAKIVAKNFFLHQNACKLSLQNQQLYLTYIFSTKEKDLIKQERDTSLPLFYIFNVTGNLGFVIVSADNDAIPILGYSNEGNFTGINMPDALVKLFDKYQQEIKYIKRNNLKADKKITGLWKENNNSSYVANLSTNSVGALLQTRWNQGTYYNDLCPYDDTYKDRSVTGCVATAMAQIMKFWNWPLQGSGFHSYNHSTYGTLSANFGSTTYNWPDMPIIVKSTNNSIARLMYDAGVSVDMDYGPEATGGSAAYVISNASPITACAEFALKTYFGYDSTLRGYVRTRFPDSTWILMLKHELDSSRPIIYTGFGQGGHAFVCDGYDNSNNFHFNWGWDGMYNGFFNINSLNPGSVGTFNNGQQALMGIKPKPANPVALPHPQAYSDISVTPNPIQYATPFTVSLDIMDSGNIDFIGDYAAVVFDKQEDFVDFVDIKTGVTQIKGTYQTINFNTTALTSVTPGDYIIVIFYKLSGNDWTILPAGTHYNAIYVTVKGPANNLALYDSLRVNPEPLIKGKSAKILAGIYNSGTSADTFDISVDLHKIDGTWITTLDGYSNVSLCAKCYFDSVPFIEDSITADPGSYLLVVWDKPKNDTNWNIVSSDYFPNPVRVVIAASPLSPDPYEPNNSDTSAYNLPVSFIGNSAHVSTPDANIHIGTDHDYYKLVLPSGSGYSIAAKIIDVGIVGSVDPVFAYNDGSGWSDNYNVEIGHNIIMSNGGTLMFAIAPYFSGNTGTYLLDINISKTNNALINVFLPSAGNTWIKGNAQTITWIDNITERVSIKLYKDYSYILTINNSAQSNGSYSWTVPDSILTDIDYQIKISSVVDSNIYDFSDYFTITNNLSINDKLIKSQLVRFYPNPVNSFLNIQLLNNDISFDHLTIINSMGKIVIDKNYHFSNQFNSLDISILQPGIYFLSLSGSQQNVSYRFSVVR
jgi:hypothetical protein